MDMGDLAELNFDVITLEDAMFLYWEDKRLLLNDGHIVGITEVQNAQEV